MKKAARIITQVMRAMQRREERKARRRRGDIAFNVHQLTNVAKFDQRLIVMGK